MKFKFYLLQKLPAIIFLALSPLYSLAQVLEVTGGNTPPFTPQNLISNVFLGDGVEVTNITYNGNPLAVGYFTGGANIIGIERGIVMTTGRAESQGALFGANSEGSDFASFDNGSSATDANLLALTTAGLNNVAVYTISFIPTADTLRFRYCFGSEEYPEYACSPFNDVFGFFIQGPGFPTFTNIAKIPGTNLPVTINNLHPANPNFGCGPMNEQYYNSNNNTQNQPTYDGFTDVFIAEAIVTPCLQYTIKLAIADVSDPIFDSGVFLEAKSFGTGSLDVEVTTLSADGAIVEGCADGTLTFKLPSPATEDIFVDYSIWGDATNGVDYQTIPSGLFIPTGQSELIIPIIAFEDNNTEGPEFIAVDIQRDPCNRDTVYIFIKENGLIAPTLRTDTTICAGSAPLELNGTLPITLPAPPSFSNTQDFTLNFQNGPIQSPVNVFGVQPTELGPGVIQSVCFNATHPWVDDIDVFLISPGGQFLELTTDNGANGDNYNNTCFTPSATNLISFPGPFAPASAAPFTGTWAPEGPWSDLWDGAYPTNGTWRLQVRDDANGFNGTLSDWTITFEPSYKINYLWSPNGAGISCPTCAITHVSPTQTTTYTVVATDSYGCSVTDSVTVSVLEALAAPVVSCNGTTASSISFSWPPVPNAISYEVNTGSGWVPASGPTDHLINGLVPNTSVTIQVRAVNPAYFCGGLIGTATCVNCQQPQLQTSLQQINCAGQNNGSITASTDNLNPPYTYTLGAVNNSTGIFNNLAAGNYLVVATDASGCSNSQQVSITAPPALTLSAAVQQQVSCFGGNNGQLVATGSGGTGLLSFKWNDPAQQTTATASNLAIGVYTVTVTDINGCTKTAQATITQPTDLSLAAQATAATCFGTATGSATASGSGGTQPYQFAWSNMVSTPNNPNLPAGNYTITVTDANGCAETSFVIVGQPTALNLTVTNTSVACNGGNNGTATAAITGGVGPYSYKWNTTPTQTTPTAINLVAQTYLVTVTDANGCSIVQGTNVASPQALVLSQTTNTVSCHGGNNGSATVAVNGGTSPYNYSWNDPLLQNTPTASTLIAGTYTVTVTDSNGCSGTSSSSISEPNPIQLSGNITNATCFGKNDGKINTSTQGGTFPFSYIWNNGETTPNLQNKLAGVYTVTVTDAKGCTATLSQTIGQPTAIQVNLSTENVKCFGQSNGTAQLTITGGTPTYTVAWTGTSGFTATGESVGNLVAGTYIATITDNAGCAATSTANIQQPGEIKAILPAFADTICFLANNGTATVQVTGGSAPFNYVWSEPGQTDQTATGLVSTAYTVTVTDAGGCSSSASTFIRQREQLNGGLIGIDPNCHDGKDGRARVQVVYYGATPANLNTFQYTWSTIPAQSGQQATNLSALQTYTVTFTDDLGCTATAEVTMGNPAPVLAQVIDSEDARCFGSATGWASASGSGGAGSPFTYFWSPGGSSQTDSLVQLLPAGTYKVTVMDAKGCGDVAEVTIGQPSLLRADVFPEDVLCFGGSDGKIKAQGIGGVPPYQYAWGTGQNGPSQNNLSAGPIQLTVTDSYGCTFVGNSNIGQPAAALSAVVQSENPACAGGRDGRINLNPGGGTPPYQYALNNGPLGGSQVFIGLKAGVYTPVLVDKNGCSVSLPPVSVTEPPAIEVDLGPDFSLLFGRDTQLIAQVNNASGIISYAWLIQDSTWLSCLTCPNPLVEDLETTHWFQVEVTDENGCTGLDRIRIEINKIRNVYVPTGFTPNGDLENDILMVHGRPGTRLLDFRVYDRWGEMVFQSKNFDINDQSAGWDGRFRGKDMDPGTFVWVLEVEHEDGYREILKGNTTLIR
jgi:gliding motility-associated-like protein